MELGLIITSSKQILILYCKCFIIFDYRFLEAYEKQGISFYGLTTQNEPSAGLFAYYPFNALGWMPTDQVK